MKKIALFLALSSLPPGASALAQEVEPVTQRTEREAAQGTLQNEGLAIKPQLGTLVYQDARDETTARGAAGAVFEWNMNRASSSKYYIGPSTGVIYSHLGDPSSNFFGTNASSPTGNAGANLLLIPANIKVGYTFPGLQLRTSLRAGANITYRSTQGATSLSEGDFLALTSTWTAFPNVGLDLEAGPLMIRPDFTLGPRNLLFSGTVGFNIPLG